MHIIFFESKILQRIKYFSRKPPKSNISSCLESSHLKPYKTMALLRRPSIHLNNSLTRLIVTFYETAQANYSRAKFDNVLRTFLLN